jgi:methyl-accepting chemotaxis protein
MSKINRIGNKLGLAGVVGILLSAGIVANQMITESSVIQANQRADAQQKISDNVTRAETQMRNMQLAIRGIRLAKTRGEIEKGSVEFQTGKSDQEQNLDAASSLAIQEDKERFAKIKALTNDYSVAAIDLTNLQYKVLELYGKRDTVFVDLASKLNTFLASPALTGSPNRHEIESQFRDVDGALNGVLAAAWRFAATNEPDQKEKIVRNAGILSAALGRARGLAEGKVLSDGIETLGSGMKNLLALIDETVKSEDGKSNIIKIRTLPNATQAAELMQMAMSIARKSVSDSKAAAANELLQANRLNLGLSIAMMLCLVGSVVFSFLGIARPMTRLNGAMGQMAAGNLDVVIPGAHRGDEIGDMAKTIAVIRDNAEQNARDEAETKTRQDKIAADQRKADMYKLADDFESAVGEIIETVTSASTELEASASTLTATAERSQELSTMVAAASEEASTNVQSVASATEEMTSSVNEISRRVQESARIANDAVDQARKTNDRVGELSKAASRIGDVVELINTIAGQTNLLALNATIEAARAGDAGRGFAVVASEVKALAEQTAKATGEIGQQINGIQAATRDSVAAIKEIGDTIGQMSEISSTIASAIEEQGAATQEISRNVQQAAQGTMQVSSNVADVQRGATETGSASSQVLSASKSLSGESHRLKAEVRKFLNSVRAA